MGLIIFSTVGTSLIEKLKVDESGNFKEYKYDDNSENFCCLVEKGYKRLCEKVNNVEKYSAEIHSLLKFGIYEKEIEQIYFLVSDTLYGAVCGAILKKYLSKIKSEIIKLDELNAKNTKGITNSILEKVCNLFDKYRIRNNECYINITGGFKSVIPYFSILSMLYKMHLFYIFEDSDTLINLPPLPIEYDYLIIEGYEKIIENAIKNNSITNSEYTSLPEQLKILFQEETDNKYIPLALLTLLVYSKQDKVKIINYTDAYNENQIDIDNFFNIDLIVKDLIRKLKNLNITTEKQFNDLRNENIKHSKIDEDKERIFTILKDKAKGIQYRILYIPVFSENKFTEVHIYDFETIKSQYDDEEYKNRLKNRIKNSNYQIKNKYFF